METAASTFKRRLQRLYGYNFGLLHKLSRLYQELEDANNELDMVLQSIETTEEWYVQETAKNINSDLTIDDFTESWIEQSIRNMKEVTDSEVEELE